MTEPTDKQLKDIEDVDLGDDLLEILKEIREEEALLELERARHLEGWDD